MDKINESSVHGFWDSKRIVACWAAVQWSYQEYIPWFYFAVYTNKSGFGGYNVSMGLGIQRRTIEVMNICTADGHILKVDCRKLQ